MERRPARSGPRGAPTAPLVCSSASAERTAAKLLDFPIVGSVGPVTADGITHVHGREAIVIPAALCWLLCIIVVVWLALFCVCGLCVVCVWLCVCVGACCIFVPKVTQSVIRVNSSG